MWSSVFDMNSRSNSLRHSAGGFTLSELLISMTVVTMLLGGILTGVVGIARSNLVVSNHSSLNAKERNAVEQLARDVRQLNTVTAFTSAGFSGTLPSRSGASEDDVLTYSYNNGSLSRTVANAAGVETIRIPLTGISSLTFSYWTGAGLAAVPGGTSAGSIKIVQLDAVTELALGTSTNTNTVISAQFTIRSAGSL
jgi:Tfp pilus assembly protein PilW